jgi:hypothetical protein
MPEGTRTSRRWDTMDGNRFDQWSKVLGAVRSRRTVMALALALEGGGLLSLAQGKAAKKKCKPKCPECKKCKNGRCEKKSGGRCGADGTCENGKCVCKRACPACKKCNKGTCVNDNGAGCGVNAFCQGGTCACAAGTWECETGHCCPQGGTCNPSAGTCPACLPDENVCEGGSEVCGFTEFQGEDVPCVCVTSISGTTTCSSLDVDNQCLSCTSDDDCEGRLGEGVPAVCLSAPCFSGQGPCPVGTTTVCAIDGCAVSGETAGSARRIKLLNTIRVIGR